MIVDLAAFPEALAAAFNQIRQHSRSSPPVGVRLLEGLASIARRTRRPSDREAILQQAKMVTETFEHAGHHAGDLREIRKQFERVKAILRRHGPIASDDMKGDAQPSGDQSAALDRNERSSPSEDRGAEAKGEVNG